MEVVFYDPIKGVFTAKTHRGNVKAGSVLGHKNCKGYIKLRIDVFEFMAHRLAFIYMNGSAPAIIDHINGIRDDNRIENLRQSNHTLNARNSDRRKHSTSRFKGVSLHKRSNKWVAHITNARKLIYLGLFKTDVEAAFAYDMASLEIHGSHGKTNIFPLAF